MVTYGLPVVYTFNINERKLIMSVRFRINTFCPFLYQIILIEYYFFFYYKKLYITVYGFKIFYKFTNFIDMNGYLHFPREMY